MNYKILLSFVLVCVFSVGITTPGTSVVAGTLYKWVDENGRVYYQDKPPVDVEDFESADMSERDVGRLLQQDPEEQREILVEEKPITIYVADNCDACDTLRVFLQKKNVPFTEKDLTENQAAQQELMDIGGKLQVPATTIGTELVWGYSRSGLQSALASAGYDEENENNEATPRSVADDTANNNDAPQQTPDADGAEVSQKAQ